MWPTLCIQCSGRPPMAGQILCGACIDMIVTDDPEADVTPASPPAFVTKDSGRREDFPTGARRDTQDDKPRYDLIPVEPLRRLAELYGRGAAKYGEHNYQKGMPYRRAYASLFRHLMQWASGDAQEDHLAAVAWNAFALMFYEGEVAAGRLPKSLDDVRG